MADEEGRLSTLQGYEEVDKALQEYTKPVLLIAPSGMGKRTWATTRANSHGLVVTTKATYDEISPVLDSVTVTSAFTWILEVEPTTKYAYLLSALKRIPVGVTVLAYSHVDVPQSIINVVDAFYLPMFSDDMMYRICADFGLKEDEADFAVKAAAGVPGNIKKSFELLRSRTLILDMLEYIRDNNFRELLKLSAKATDTDMELLESILTSYKTGVWTYFTETEAEPLRRITGLLEAVLWGFDKAPTDVKMNTISIGAIHAYHGRV